MKKILKEITPLASDQLFFAKNTPDDKMEFPLHYHDEFELTLALTGPGQRIVGSSVESIEGEDLAIIGPNVFHCYKKKEGYEEVPANLTVIQFRSNMAEISILNTDELKPVLKMFAMVLSGGGIKFAKKAIAEVREDILKLPAATGVDRFLIFTRILLMLAMSEGYAPLSSSSTAEPLYNIKDERIDRIIKYVHSYYMNRITLDDIGDLVQMSPSAVCRYFKQKTHYRFLDYLTSYRVDQVALGMLTTNKTIAELCFSCGFNNISNFNRSFKNFTGMTPSEYREKMGQGENANNGMLLKRWSKINGTWV